MAPGHARSASVHAGAWPADGQSHSGARNKSLQNTCLYRAFNEAIVCVSTASQSLMGSATAALGLRIGYLIRVPGCTLSEYPDGHHHSGAHRHGR